jgi:hypothetical protein
MRPITYFAHGRNVEIPAEYLHLIEMKTRQDIADEYGITLRMLSARVKAEGIKLPLLRVLPIEDVLEIYHALKWPPKMRLNTL